jgi:hypothetical protein
MPACIRFVTLVVCATVGFHAGGAHAEKRVALAIGNGAYTKVGKLPNPSSDARAIAGLLRAARFDVVDVRNDLGAADMRRAIRDFSDRVNDADIAVVFYAGHGIEVKGVNYLIPVDATLERDIDVEDEAVPLERVTQIVDRARRLRLILLDACRDNPFLRSMKRVAASRTIGRGLAKVEVSTADTLIGFAAKHGFTAADGDGANSPYTLALVRHLTTPGLDVRLALGRVRDDVLMSTGNRQEPYVYGSLGGAVTALVPASDVSVPPPPLWQAPYAAPATPPQIDANGDGGGPSRIIAASGSSKSFGVGVGEAAALTAKAILVSVREPDLRNHRIRIQVSTRGTMPMRVGQEIWLARGDPCRLALVGLSADRARFLLKC